MHYWRWRNAGRPNLGKCNVCSCKKIKNLCIIIDYNKFQNELSIKETLPMGNIKKKWQSFGFQVKDIDGHNFDHISKAINSF